MILLIQNIRKLVFLFSGLLAVAIYLAYASQTPPSSLLVTQLVDAYAFAAVIFLYFALLASPLFSLFPALWFKPIYLRARKAIGDSAFFFALIHALLALFAELGTLHDFFLTRAGISLGSNLVEISSWPFRLLFPDLNFLSDNYLLPIVLSFIALFILAAMTLTSLQYFVVKLGKRWKTLHRFVYLAGLLVVIHAFLIGTHFTSFNSTAPRLFFAGLVALLVLEALRFDKYLLARFPKLPKLSYSLVVVSVSLTATFFYFFFPSANNGGSSALNVHAAHLQLAQQALQTSQQSQTNNVNPSLNGDRTKRYTASFNHSDTVQAGQDTTLNFNVYDASSGAPVIFFVKAYAYPMHLIIVDSSLTYFEHIHPDEDGSGNFSITTQFPNPGLYHLYVQFQPLGGIEQQMAFTLPVGIDNASAAPAATQPVDSNLTKIFGDYEVTLDLHGGLNAADMTLGKDKLSYTIKDAKTKQPITTLKPFMNSFGHLSMINEKTYDFLHVHPYSLAIPAPDANGGPTVDFLPIGIYGPFKPGIYRVFGEFSTKIGEDFDTNFTVEVK